MEIPSRSSTSCFDFALDDYLHSYHISCSSSTSCFDLVLDCLAQFDKFYFYWDIKNLKKKVRLLKTFYLFVKNKGCRRRNSEALLEHEQVDKDNIMSESSRLSSICSRIQDVTVRMVHDLQSACLLYKHSDEPGPDILQSALTRSWENIILFLETDIKKSCTIIVSDCYSPGDPQLVMDLIVSLLENLEDLFNHKREKLMDTIKQKLMLLRNLIGFVTMRGVESTQLTDLLTHVAVVAIRLISVCQFDSGDEQVFNQMEYKISLLIHVKLKPLDPQVRETCIHVLTASKMQSRSSSALVHKENEYPVVVQLIDSLQEYLVDLLGSYASFQVPVKDQMLKLHWGVSCLRILLKQEEKLGDEIKDLIGVMVCDTGIMIFSISVNEIKEGLPKEIELGLFNFHNVLKYMMEEVAHNYPLTWPYSSSNYPRSIELGCMDFFLENLTKLGKSKEADDSIEMVQEDLVFLRRVLENIKEQRYQNGKLQAFWSRVMVAACKAELLIDSTLVGDKCEDSLDAVARDINLLKIESLEIHNGQPQRINKISAHIPPQLTATIHNRDLVVYDEDVRAIIQRLIRGSRQLDVVPIVGMPGLGASTVMHSINPTLYPSYSTCKIFAMFFSG